MVDGVFPFQDDLRNGHEGVTLLQQAFNDTRQRFRSVEGSVMEQHNAPRLDFARHPLGNICGGQILPVQAVATGSSCKDRQQLDSLQMEIVSTAQFVL